LYYVIQIYFHNRELNFEANLRSTCENIDFFDEGIEVSIGGEDDWTPLAFLTLDQVRSPKEMILIPGQLNNNSINISGYSVPVYYQTSPTPLQISLCIDALKYDSFKIRWLQTTSLFIKDNYIPKDVWTLSDIYIGNSTDQGRKAE